MISELVFSTKDKPERYGGLLVCGTNFGLGPDGLPYPEEYKPPWADYFTHYESNRKGDRFISGLRKWFSWWNIPLEVPDGKPTELNKAITQTNLFYDSTDDFSLRSNNDMSFAFSRLKRVILRFDISGLLIASSKLAPLLRDSAWLPPGEFQLEKTHYGRVFWLEFGSAGPLRVALCPHPTSPQSQDDVASLHEEMRRWIAEVMEEYRRKQSRLTNSPSSCG